MLLGIDLGTGSAKALLIDCDGQPIAEASSPYSVKAPQPGWAESNPIDWWAAVAIAVRSATENRAHQVQAIGLSGQMHGVVLADREGLPLRPAILWADTRSSRVLERYQALDPALRRCLANPITAGMAGCTLLWLHDHESENYASARWVLQPKDWLRLRLTGCVATDPSDASGTLLYDLLANQWAWDVLDALGLRHDWLPDIAPSIAIAGSLLPQVAESLGLPQGLSVVMGAADTAAAALGSGLLKPGLAQLTVGSGAQIIVTQAHPIPNPNGRTHLFRSALSEQWYALAAIQNAGLALEWVRGLLGFSWAQVYAEAFAVSLGCEGLTFLPYLMGDRTPHLDPHARGAWVGLGLHHTRAHLMRAALEGVAFSLRQGLAAIPGEFDQPGAKPFPEELRLAGGGALEEPWKQLLADVLQVPLRPVAIASASARGAALLAGIGVGIYSDVNAIPQPERSVALTVPNAPSPALEEAQARFDSLYFPLKQWRQSQLAVPSP